MKKLLTLLLLINICSSSIAQNKWMNLPNKGFYKGAWHNDSTYRIEDVYFVDTNVGYAVALPGLILKTINGGISWKIKNDSLDTNTRCSFRSIEFLDGGKYGITGSLGVRGNVLRTTDSGETWINIDPLIPDNSPKMRRNICGLAHYGDTFFGVGYWGSDTGRFYKSTDKGASWTMTYVDTNVIRNLVDVVFTSADTGFIAGAYKNWSAVAKTTDGGVTWSRVFVDSVIGGRIWKIQVLENYVFGSIEPRFFKDTVCMIRSEDYGMTWKIIAAGSIKSTVNAIGTQGVGFATPAKGWIGGYYKGIFETIDSGKTWTYVNFGNEVNRIFVIDSSHVFAGGIFPYKYGSGIYYNNISNAAGEHKVLNEIKVSPNPAKDNVRMEINLQMGTNVLLEVFNVDSRKTYRIVNNYYEKGTHIFNWDCSSVPAGNYVVWFDNNEIPQAKKLVVGK